MKKPLAAVAVLSVLVSPAWATDKTVTLSVPGMYCSVCPITVKKALTRVNGVIRVAVDFDKRQAVMTYDDAKTQVEALTKATADAGYPSSVKQ